MCGAWALVNNEKKSWNTLISSEYTHLWWSLIVGVGNEDKKEDVFTLIMVVKIFELMKIYLGMSHVIPNKQWNEW